MATEPEWRLSPHAKQWDLIDCGADIAIYGGAAGGGKSFALLAEPICRGLHETPGFYGIIFRRTSKQVTEAGALWDQASKIYPYVGGEAHVGSLEYRFPSGAKIGFRHIEHEQDKHNYAGSEICYLGFDELYHFTESQFLFLTSRNRSVCGVKPYIRATTNPDPGWLRDYIAPWVHDEYDGPRAVSGQVLWQVRTKGKIQYVPEGTPDARSVTFIKARLTDNPTIAADYEATLKALPEVECERLLHGNWNVRREGLVYAGFEECIVDTIPDCSAGPARVGGMDFGIHNPFATVHGHVDHDGVLWITGGRYKSGTTIAVHSEHLPKSVQWWCDPAGTEQWLALKQAGHDIRPCVHKPTRGASGEKKNPKLAGIDMVSQRIREGRLKIVRCPETMPLIRELGMYHYDEAKKLEEPVDEDNHACFPAGTLVTTLAGQIPIESVRAGQSVLTRAGYRRVAVSGMVSQAKPLWRVTLSDGRTLDATPDHPIWVSNKGFTRLDALRYGDIMDVSAFTPSSVRGQSWNATSKPSYSMGLSFGGIPNRDTRQRETISSEASCFTKKYGKQRTARSRKVMTFTTLTTTHRTTISAIFSVSPKQNITLCMQPSEQKNSFSDSESKWKRCDLSLLNGTAQKRGLLGMPSTANEPGRDESRSRRTVSFAGQSLEHETDESIHGSAQESAALMPGRQEELITKFGSVRFARSGTKSISTPTEKPAPVTVVSVYDLGRSEPVYNLTVEGQHEYYANGVLVSNCDALRYLIVGLDRGRSVSSILPVQSDAERAEQEEAERIAHLYRRKQLDLEAQQDPFNERWGWS